MKAFFLVCATVAATYFIVATKAGHDFVTCKRSLTELSCK